MNSFQVRAFIDRLLEGRGPKECICLLKEALPRALRFAGVSLKGRRQFFEELERLYGLRGEKPARPR